MYSVIISHLFSQRGVFFIGFNILWIAFVHSFRPPLLSLLRERPRRPPSALTFSFLNLRPAFTGSVLVLYCTAVEM